MQISRIEPSDSWATAKQANVMVPDNKQDKNNSV